MKKNTYHARPTFVLCLGKSKEYPKIQRVFLWFTIALDVNYLGSMLASIFYPHFTGLFFMLTYFVSIKN